MNTFRVFVLALAMMATGFLIGGRYQVVPVDRADAYGLVYIVDRFTGKALYCLGIDCRAVRDPLPPAPPPQRTNDPVQPQ